MCGKYNFSKESGSEPIQAVLGNLQNCRIDVKTGGVFPGDIAAAIASNRILTIVLWIWGMLDSLMTPVMFIVFEFVMNFAGMEFCREYLDDE